MQRHWLQFQALFLSLLVVGNLVSAADWSVVDKVLNEGIAKHTTPGLVAAVANKNVRDHSIKASLHECIRVFI
jgi:hypothetical protein